MAEIVAVLTKNGRRAWAQLFAGGVGYTVPDDAPPTAGWNPIITHFKYGEGGWQDLGAGPVPRTPSNTLTYASGPDIGESDLDAAIDAFRIDPPRYPLDSRFTFEKALIPADITIEGIENATLRLRCRLELAEANNDGFGNNPEFWEIGIFCQHPTVPALKLMLAYATMPKEIKHGAKVLENVIRIYF